MDPDPAERDRMTVKNVLELDSRLRGNDKEKNKIQYKINFKVPMNNIDNENQIDVKAIMMDFERSSFMDEVKDFYSQGLIDKDLYVLLSQSDLSNKLKIYQMQRTGFIFRIVNKILRIYFKLLYKMMEPVLNSQEKINKKLVLEIIKLKIGRDSKKD